MKIGKLLYFGILCILFAVVLAIGCTRLRRAPSPEKPREKVIEEEKSLRKDLSSGENSSESSKKPDLPAALWGSQGKEPELKVFVQEENQVKEMKMEEYVTNVVAGEIENHWPDEAIKAQAIIVRTFVLNFIEEKGHSKWGDAHISTDISEAQAWDPQSVNEKIKKAVEDTRGKVMVCQGKFAQSWFHSNAAGITATAKEGLNYKKAEPSYIKSVKSPDDSEEIPKDERYWEHKTEKNKVLRALKNMGESIDNFDKVSIGEKGPSGRAITLIFGENQVSAPDFRVAMGSTEMKSTLLDAVELQGDYVVFKGRGYGHGVGMSQWGAYRMAKEGKKAEEILKHYFDNIDIVEIWSGQ